MSVNKYKIVLPPNDKQIDIPIELKWDFGGKTDSVEEYEKTVFEEVIGKAADFEVVRFSHAIYNLLGPIKTSMNYEFKFYSGLPQNISASTVNNYSMSYLALGFTPSEVYYYSKPFTNSFFKLDFYDTPNPTTQRIYFTIILPVQQGLTQNVSISQSLPNVNIKRPKMRLDSLGDKEGFFIYWLRKQDFLDISTFYMSAKFFDGRNGNFITMTNVNQNSIPNPYNFDGSDYFYYVVDLDYNDKTYRVFRPNNNIQRVGRENFPVVWYQYVNPV